MQRLPSLFERVTDERSPLTFVTDFCKIDERNLRAVTKDYTRATYPAWRELMWYGELPRKERKVIPALHRTRATLLQLNFAMGNLLKLRRKSFASKFKNSDEATFG